ncbi:uroporphyrinogen-III synthase [Glycocaulis profundi]|nr:uroporphyrinogen-III synthase [Glycocaulis profundi]
MGLKPVLTPVAGILFLDRPVTVAPDAALAFTSPNGVAAFARLSRERGRPVFTVGDATADAARTSGFENVLSAGGDVNDLARLVADHADHVPELVHFGGQDRAGDLPGMLLKAGISARTDVLYEATPASALTPEAIAALDAGGAAVLAHSPKGAERFVTLADAAGLCGRLQEAVFVAISQAAAEPLTARGLKVHASAAPDEAGLLAALAGALGLPPVAADGGAA